MTNITCVFYENNKKHTINKNNIVSVKINSKQATVVIMSNSHFDNMQFHYCEISTDLIKFIGNVIEINCDKQTCTYLVEALGQEQHIYEVDKTDTLMQKFCQENPDIFQPRCLKLNREPINIDNWIETLNVSVNQKSPIKTVNLRIKASWLKSVYGRVDITNKLRYILLGKTLATITPNKLMHSWFKTFDFLQKTSRQYFIAHSKLTEERSTPITFDKKLTLKKSEFKYELAVGWEYEQLETEEIQCKITNNAIAFPPITDELIKNTLITDECNSEQPATVNSISDKTTVNKAKEILIDLHNIQEYLPDTYQQSFFKTDVGKKISNLILREIIEYMKNSLDNIMVQLRVPICSDLPQLLLYQPIKLYDYIVYIKELTYVYTANANYMDVTCIGSQYKPITINNEVSLVLTKDETRNITVDDVIDKIIIQNDADTQISKLHDFITKSTCENGSTKDLKTSVNDFLNKYQTKVIIKTKPLKTSYMNKTVHVAMPINLG